MLGGALLAYLALRNAVPADKAVDPNQMYLIGFSHVFNNTTLAIAARCCSSSFRSSRSTSPTPTPARWPGPTSSPG
jgi:hypothetical protein